MQSLMFVTFAWLSVCAWSSETYKAYAGRTGSGKSYIVRSMGCDTKSCPGSLSCTKQTIVCHEKLQIDMVGLDDDGEDYRVSYQGKDISVSGFTYPVYNLFETLENNKISSVQFFMVFDANNVKFGGSSAVFLNFVKNELKCPIVRVLNKYRYDEPNHVQELKPGDQIFPNHAASANIQGQTCRFALAPDWRLKLLDTDLKAVISRVDVTNCDKLVQRKKEAGTVLAKIPEEVILDNCTISIVTGTYNTGGWSIDLGIFSIGSKGETKEIITRGVDEDCASRREENIKLKETANQRLHEEKLQWMNMIVEIDKSLAECRLLPNWKE